MRRQGPGDPPPLRGRSPTRQVYYPKEWDISNGANKGTFLMVYNTRFSVSYSRNRGDELECPYIDHFTARGTRLDPRSQLRNWRVCEWLAVTLEM
jgi:hypothetical protein